jgi:hypothetical protein
VSPVGTFGSLRWDTEEDRRALWFPISVGQEFMAAVLALSPHGRLLSERSFGKATVFAGVPIIVLEASWFVFFDPPPTCVVPTLVDSECNPMPSNFELPENSRVRCAGRITQRDKRVVLQLRAIQVIDPRPGYAELFQPIMGGYVFCEDAATTQSKNRSVRAV